MKEFKVKSSEDIAKLSEEDNAKYFAGLLDWQTKSIEELRVASKEDGAKKDELESQLKELQKQNVDVMKSQLDAMGGAVAKLTKEVEAKTEGKSISFKTALYTALTEKADDLKGLSESNTKNVRLEIKASQDAADITSGTDFAEMVPGVGQLATRQTFMRSLFNQRNTNKEYIKYNDQESIVRDAKNVAGCAASTHNSKITWQVRTLQITKVRDYVDVCIDMMDDYEWVSGEIRDLVSTDVALKIDENLLLSDGVYPNTNSVANVASTFAAGDYATSVQAPTLVDLIQVGSCLISDAGLNNKFNANVAVLNPSDKCLMTLEKDANNNYLIPNWITSDGVNIGAVRVVTNSLVPANEMYVMDSTKGTVVSRRGTTVEFGFENNDNFEKELVTVKAYERLNFLVRNVDANAFMHVPDIDAAIIAITK